MITCKSQLFSRQPTERKIASTTFQEPKQTQTNNQALNDVPNKYIESLDKNVRMYCYQTARLGEQYWYWE